MIHGTVPQGGEITANATTINRDDVWPGQGKKGEMLAPRMAIVTAGIETKIRRLMNPGCYAKTQTEGTDRASSNCATVPRLPGEVKMS